MQFVAAELIIFYSTFYLCVKVIGFLLMGIYLWKDEKRLADRSSVLFYPTRVRKVFLGFCHEMVIRKLLLSCGIYKGEYNCRKAQRRCCTSAAIEVGISQLSGVQVLQNYANSATFRRCIDSRKYVFADDRMVLRSSKCLEYRNGKISIRYSLRPSQRVCIPKLPALP